MRFCILILFVLLLTVAVGKQQANAAPQSTLAVVTASDAICGGLFFKRPGRICPGPNCPTPNKPGPPPEIEPPPIPEPIPEPEPEPVAPPVVSIITKIPEPEGMGTAAIIGLLSLAGVLGGGIAVARYINQ